MIAKVDGEHLCPLSLLSQDRSEVEYTRLVGLLGHFLSNSEILHFFLLVPFLKESLSLFLYDTLVLARPVPVDCVFHTVGLFLLPRIHTKATKNGS